MLTNKMLTTARLSSITTARIGCNGGCQIVPTNYIGGYQIAPIVGAK